MSDPVHDAQRLMELQHLPLDRKIQITQTRIIEFYQHYQGQVCISFSGGKDSTVLLHIARQLYPEIPAVFSNTGLEYPEIQRFVKSFDHVDIVTPAMNFSEVVSNYGYPLIGKEVAEAIHYARRIRSHSGNVERERERARELKRTELNGNRTSSKHRQQQIAEPSCQDNGSPMRIQANRNGGGRTEGPRRLRRTGTTTNRGRESDLPSTDSEPG